MREILHAPRWFTRLLFNLVLGGSFAAARTALFSFVSLVCSMFIKDLDEVNKNFDNEEFTEFFNSHSECANTEQI